MICQNPSCSYLSAVEALCSVLAYIKTYILRIAFSSNSARFAFRQKLSVLYRQLVKFCLLRIRSNPHVMIMICVIGKRSKAWKCKLLDKHKNICYNPIGEVYFILYIISYINALAYSYSRPDQIRDGLFLFYQIDYFIIADCLTELRLFFAVLRDNHILIPKPILQKKYARCRVQLSVLEHILCVGCQCLTCSYSDILNFFTLLPAIHPVIKRVSVDIQSKAKSLNARPHVAGATIIKIPDYLLLDLFRRSNGVIELPDLIVSIKRKELAHGFCVRPCR